MERKEAIEKLKRFGDNAERLYAEEILIRFPNYAVLWADLIGNQDLQKPRRFGLEFHDELSEVARDKLNEQWDYMCQAHYTVLCKLGSMHDYLCEAKEALKLPLNDPRREVDHRRAFDSFYSAFGGVEEIYKSMFTKILRYNDRPQKRLYDKQSPNKSFLHQNKKCLEAWKKVLHIYGTLRRHIDHFVRPPFRLTENGDYVIKEITSEDIDRKLTWSQIQNSGRRDVSTTSLLEEHLEIVETALNVLHELLVREVKEFFKRNNLKVKKSFPIEKVSNETTGASPITTSGTETQTTISSIGSSTTRQSGI